MSFLATVERTRDLLQRNRRVSLRALRREFDLDDETLDELCEELVDVQRVATREGNVLVWSGPAAPAPEPQATPEPSTERAPLAYTPKHLADRILRSKSALEGERKQVSVLFADVKSSMELAGQLDPEVWHGILERFFEILAEGVHRFEGTVNQYTGDGIMALFGAPISHEDHALRAGYATLYLLDRLRDYGRDVRREYGLDFATRIGLNSGEVVVGKIGDDLRMDYTAQGQTVGLAQRVESLAEADACFLTEATADLLRGYFTLEDLGDFRVKGVDEPLHVFRLAGLGEARTRFDVSRARGLSRFVGRAAEIRTLQAALEAARSGNGSVVGVVAQAGTGKSRLCFEFAESCRGAGFVVHEGHAVAHGKSVPLIPVLEIFRSYFEIGSRDDDRSAREKVAGRLLLLDEGFREVLPVLFEFLGIGDPGAPAPHVEPEARRRQLLGVSQRLLKRSSAERPAVILIEDLHWLDEASEGWLRDWVEAIAGTHSILLLNFRPEYKAEWMQRTHVQQIALAPLGAEAIRELVADLVGSDPSTTGLADAIHARTGGNPFFAEEIVRSLVESGQLAGERGHYRLVTPAARIEVPGSVQTLLAARIDRLPEREKRVLQAAAVIGKEFRGPVLEQVLELPAAEVGESLGNLRGAEFVYEESLYPVAEYSFKHPLTQEVALGSQLAERRRATHAAAARAIEVFDAARLDEQAAVLAHHWEEAGEALPAARWHARAAAWMMGSDTAAAYRHWVRVRELAAGIETDEARALEGEALIELVNLGWRAGHPLDEVRGYFEAARRRFEASGDRRSLCLLHSNYSLVPGLEGPTAVASYREANRLARELGDPALQIVVGVGIEPPLMAGLLRESLGWADACIGRIEARGPGGPALLHYDPRAWIHSGRAHARMLLGNVAEAFVDSDRGLSLARERTDFDRMVAHMIRSALESLRGDPMSALDHARRHMEIAEKLGGTTNRGQAATSLGSALARVGRADEAIPWLLEAQTLRGRVICGSSRGLASALLATGDPDRALAVAQEDVVEASERGLQALELEFQIERAEVAARTGHESEARAALARAHELVARTECRILVPAIHEAAAVLAEALGDEATERSERREALRLYRKLGADGHAERLAHELGTASARA